MKWPGLWTLVDNCYCEFAGPYGASHAGRFSDRGLAYQESRAGAWRPPAPTPWARPSPSPGSPPACTRRDLGAEAGSCPWGYRDLYQGLFLAPKVVGECLKGIIPSPPLSCVALGFEVDPGPFDERSDIVQSGDSRLSREAHSASRRPYKPRRPWIPFAVPRPWDMPGYDRQIIMAAGTFVQGSSMELSRATGHSPSRTLAYLQGGLTKEHVMLAVRRAALRVLTT
ncbi:MAG: methionine gamma-lyase family protein [Bacillota bacterium]